MSFPNAVRARVYYILSIFLGMRFGSDTYRIPLGIYAKALDNPEEALATEFVRRHTTVPVPKVLDVIYDTFIGEAFHGKSFIMITKEIPGRPLYGVSPKFRIHTATPEQKEIFKNTLFDWLTQLRSIPPPHPHKISGFLGGGLRSYRIESGIRVGPYKNPAELHGQNFCGARADVPGMAEDPVGMQRLIDERPIKRYHICLTHGDILPHNFLVDDSGCSCGLIDWECDHGCRSIGSIRIHFGCTRKRTRTGV